MKELAKSTNYLCIQLTQNEQAKEVGPYEFLTNLDLTENVDYVWGPQPDIC